MLSLYHILTEKSRKKTEILLKAPRRERGRVRYVSVMPRGDILQIPLASFRKM
jgi:hypothetical protein